MPIKKKNIFENIKLNLKNKDSDSDTDSDTDSEKAEEMPKPKRKGGRPKGSKNKKGIKKEEIPKPKRKGGRPKGSKNKPKGEGIVDSIKTFGQNTLKKAKKAVNSVSNTATNISNSVSNYTNAVINGRNDFPPKVRKILEQYGNDPIESITICRTPVPSVLTGIMSAVSLGAFGKNMKDSPYDTLFHLFIRIKVRGGTYLSLEKNEVINMDINPSIPKDTQTEEVNPIPQGITIDSILDKAKEKMGSSFFAYSARDNNCQHFISSVLSASGIGNAEDQTFIKQNTEVLFEGLSGLRKFSNTITDIGGKANVIMNGAGISDWEHIKWGSFTKQFNAYNKHHQPLKDLEEFAIMILKEPHKYQEKTLKRARFYKNVLDKKNKMSVNSIMPKKGGSLKSKLSEVWDKVPEQYHQPLQQIGETALKDVYGRGGFSLPNVKGKLDNVWYNKVPEQYHQPLQQIGESAVKDMGFGITIHQHHHHHHHHPEGMGMWDWADPKKNGVAKAFDPKQNGVAKAFAPGGSAEQFGKEVGHYGIPAITSGLGGLAGGVLGGLATGGAGGEFVGGAMGSAAGAKAGDAINKAIGIGFKKGSQEAKDHMARIRGMRKKKH